MKKQTLESIYTKYHHPRYLGLDPLICVHQFKDKSKNDLEIIGLLSAALAYGRVEIIVRNINAVINIMDTMGKSPTEFIAGTSYKEKFRLLDGKNFKHRFNDSADIAALFESIKTIMDEWETLEACFVDCMEKSGNDFKGALILFTDIIKEKGRVHCGRRASFEYLIPSPSRGSACKRMVLYLRWMVRKADGIDLGVWEKVSPSRLLIPVDTHVAKIARGYGLTARKSADWKMAEEITAALREFDPDDPVKYDFSLCHAGMVGFRGG